VGHAAMTRKVIHMFDSGTTLSASDAPLSANASRFSGLLASSLLLVIGAALCLLVLSISSKTIDSSNAVLLKPYVSVKEYAAQKIQSKDQWVCLSQLYGKESAWNHRAVGNLNGNAPVYGIPQLKNPLMLTKTEYEQVDYGLKYIAHRYKFDKYGYINACKALKHFELEGWH
jgi:hypothetical protein